MKTTDQLTLDDILERKRRARTELARLPFAKKIEIVERLRERLEPFNVNRARRAADRAKASAE